MQFIIIHGAFGSPEENWFPQLQESLEALGQKVFVPQFPVDNWDEITQQGQGVKTHNQTLANWLSTFETVLAKINPSQPICIIGHSLGPLFTLHAVAKFNLKLDCAIFVSPFLTKLNTDWQIDTANETFYKSDFDFKKLNQLIPLSFCLYSANDPYVKPSFPIKFAQKLGSSIIPITNAGHMNTEVNLNEFPLVLELCKSRLDLNLYQKYKAHRSELYDINYNQNQSEEVIYLDPKEVRDEGIFHFRNLRKGGFCTCITGTEFWQSQSKYMEEARKAAQRTHNFTRVFVVMDIKDLTNAAFIKQVDIDLTSGVNVMLIPFIEIKDSIPDPDFGIWDNEYRCVVRFNNHKQVQEVELSSRKRDLSQAQKWQEIILQKATQIYQLPEDIDTFIQIHQNNQISNL